jgi:hypothetical protein
VALAAGRCLPAVIFPPAGDTKISVSRVALDVLGYNNGSGGGVKWRTRGGIDQATGEKFIAILSWKMNLQALSPQRDVKNEGRTDYVYESIRKETKCIPFVSAYIAQKQTERKATDETQAAFRLKLQKGSIFRREVAWNSTAETQRYFTQSQTGNLRARTLTPGT